MLQPTAVAAVSAKPLMLGTPSCFTGPTARIKMQKGTNMTYHAPPKHPRTQPLQTPTCRQQLRTCSTSACAVAATSGGTLASAPAGAPAPLALPRGERVPAAAAARVCGWLRRWCCSRY